MKSLLRKFGASAGLVSLLLASLGAPVHATGSPSLTPSPAAQRVANGNTVKVTLHIDPNGTALNTVNVVAHYPADKLTFMGLDKSGAYFDAFIPADPSAKDGSVSFAASALQRGSTTDSVVVGSLLFKATADSDTASVSFGGTQAANGGGAIDVDASNASVSFDPASTNSTSAVSIRDIHVTNVTTTGGSLSWQTNVPTTGNVDYGTSTKYGSSVSSDTLSTDHQVDLDSLFAGKSTVHFQITAVAGDSQSQKSVDRSFVTLGYPVQITVVNSHQQTVADVPVKLAGHTSAKTGKDGTVVFTDVAPGTQKVVAGSGKAQVIVVKAVLSDAASKPQQFTLKEMSATVQIVASIVLLVALVIAGTWAVMWFRKSNAKA